MNSNDLGTVQGSGEVALARLVAELVRQGVTFKVRLDLDGEWFLTMTGGY